VAAGAALWPAAARAQDAVTIGLLPPAAGATARALEQGASLGLDDANALAVAFGRRLRLAVETVSGAAGAARAARTLAGGGALAVIGGAGAGVGEALADVAAGGHVVFNVGAADDRLRNERCASPLFHVLPSVSMHADALARWLADSRKLAQWAAATDGSARGREIEAAMRRAAARVGASLVEAGAAEVLWLAVDDAAAGAAVSRARAEGRAPDRVAGIGAEAALALPPAARALGTRARDAPWCPCSMPPSRRPASGGRSPRSRRRTARWRRPPTGSAWRAATARC
jgi:ABC-type branched-subunit amino acid transport system substrate-binding protein